MSELLSIEGLGVPLPIDNLDTDQIMPKQFLRIIDKAGLQAGLLYDLRFDADGAVREECVLNQSAYRGANILLGGANFGCGSSREHAVWGLQQFGFQAVIASSFAEIFYSNAMNNRLLLVQLDQSAINALMAQGSAGPITVSIDIAKQQVIGPAGDVFAFPIGARHKKMVIEGMDTIDLTLSGLPAIEAFESRHYAQHAWASVL